jgi:hypothetical protein
MMNPIRKMAVCCTVAAAFVMSVAAPSLGQIIVVEPYYGGPYSYGGPYPNASPYGGYAYAPAPGDRRAWEYPIGEDNTGRPYFRDDLGWRPGPPRGAPANPCFDGQRQKNLC